MAKVLISGSKGTIGSVVAKELEKTHDVTRFDLPNHNLLDYRDLLSMVQDVDTVIHLAKAKKEGFEEDWDTDKINPDSIHVELNVFKAVIEAGVKRLIMASSVHADNFLSYEGQELLETPGSYSTVSPYGTHKLILEEMGRFFSRDHGFEFIGVRFGGVSDDNSVKLGGREPQVWLSHDDLSSAMLACVNAESAPGNFALFYAVSDNDGRLHSTENPFGWQPKDNSRDFPPHD